MNGQEVKALIKGAGVKLWEVAEFLGMSDGNFSRRLRKPFSNEDVENIKCIVNKLAKQNKNTND